MPQFDVAAAKKAGYTDAQIADFLASEKGFDASAARDAGYDDSQLVSHLSGGVSPTKSAEDKVAYKEPEAFKGFDPKAQAEYESKIGTNKPTVLTGNPLDESQLGAGMRGIGRAALPTGAGWAGAMTGAGIGAMGGPLAPVTVPVGAIIGGLAGGIGANAFQEGVLKSNREFAARIGQSPEQRAKDVEEYPITSFASEFGPGFLLGRPSAGSAKVATGVLNKVVGGVTGNVGAATLGGGLEALRENFTGEKMDPGKIAAAAAMTAAQRKSWGLGNLTGLRLTPVQEAIIKSKGVNSPEARQIVEDIRGAGANAVPFDIVDEGVHAAVQKGMVKSPTAAQLAAKYAEGVQTETPTVGQNVVSQLAPTDVRTAEQAAAEAAKDIAEHPDVVAAKPAITRGEAGASVHERLNNERDAAWSGVNQAYEEARTMGDAFVTPESANEIIQSIDKALEPAKRRYKTEIPSTMNILGYASELINGGKPKIQDLFDVRSDLTAIMGDKAGTPDAAAAREMRTALDKVVDDLDAGGMIVGDPSAVAAWRNAISSRREFGTKFEGNDIIESLTDRTSKGGVKTTVVDPADVENVLFGKGSVSGAKGQTDNLRRLRERLGETSPEWEAIRTAAAERLFGKDFGTPKFGATLDKFRRENPALADLLITSNDEAALSKAQGVITESVGRQGAQSTASGIISANPTDFANSVSTMGKAALRDARVAARQVFRNAMNRPKQSAGMLEQIATGVDTQDNIITLFGEDEGRKLIASSKALADRFARAGTIKPPAVEAEGEAEQALIPAAVGAAVGAKMGPFIAAANYITGLGVNRKKAEQLVTDVFDPTKTDETLKFIEKTYGRSAARNFATRIGGEVAKRESTMRNVTRVVGAGGQEAPTKETKPEEKAKEPQASTSANYDVGYLASKIESHEGLGKNPTSSAVGPFQFVSGTLAETYNQMHPDQDPITPEQADAMRSSGKITEDDLREMGNFHTQKNIDFLLENDLPITASNVYLMHFAGRGATPKVIAAEPTAPITDVLSADQIAANSNIEFEGKRFPEFTVQDLRDWANDVML